MCIDCLDQSMAAIDFLGNSDCPCKCVVRSPNYISDDSIVDPSAPSYCKKCGHNTLQDPTELEVS